jgi:hypothetical protein
MNYRDYISRVSFRFCQPQQQCWPSLWRLRKLGIHIDFLNTTMPEDNSVMKRRLAEIRAMPRMSTFAIGAIINRGVEQMAEEQVFVNVGVWHGFTFLSGMVDNSNKTCIGVDNWEQFGSPREEFLKRFSKYRGTNHHFFEMDYADYFNHVHRQKVGFYVYDGHHSYENQLRGLQIAEPFFAEGCIILIDDTNWDEPRRAILDFMSASPHEYCVILDKGTAQQNHPSSWNGIMVLQRTG